ncbi:MAG: hypothetical protein D6719_00785 [Candidatus Dadabacteria bacterium]|nr:MAG: hypothetical protein D6719_00785 [Candidatus Dadabacteria bacterium]
MEQDGELNSETLPSRGGIITARGTGDGLVLRLDGRVEPESLKGALGEFLAARKGFLKDNEVSLEWVGRKPSDDVVSEISGELKSSYNISVKSSRLKDEVKREVLSDDRGEEALSLFDGIDSLDMIASELNESSASGTKSSGQVMNDPALWDDPDARTVYTTLRSGQKIETEHTLIILGDVNSGAEIVAGGDIICLGTLRGVAHAGAYDETGGGRFIFALNLQPTQLRIGAVISRGGAEVNKSGVPEIARVDGNIIVVEPYNPRAVTNPRRL